MLQQSDLPPAARDFQCNQPVLVTNSGYAQGQPDAANIQAQLEQIGRLSGLQVGCSKAGNVQQGQQTLFNVTNFTSEFSSPTGAQQGLALIFSRLTQPQSQNSGDQVSVSPLDAGTAGDEIRAARVDYTFRAATGAGTVTVGTVRQTFFFVAWRRGKVVATVQLAALNLDPSLSDLKQLVQTLDQRLQANGY